MLRRTPLIYLASNWISLLGVILVTSATILWLLSLPVIFRGPTSNPYIGLLTFLTLPGVFFAGLVLIPIGIFFHVRKQRRAGHTGPLVPRGNELQRLATFVAITTVLNLVIGSQFIYSAISYMDTDTFCGKSCHTVMQPEYTAYVQSPHSRVACVDCHIGPGAGWFVKSKISGSYQLLAVALHNYPTPIPAPVQSLRPSRDTCEQCHWPQRFSGNVMFVHTEYSPDEANTALTTVAAMKVGGRTYSGSVGIHGAHADEKSRITYVSTDDKRQVIPQVTFTQADGKSVVYNATDAKPTSDQLAKGEHRTMDCIDCHNRPTHVFQLPERAVDQLMSEGRISPKLPFIKKEAVDVLHREYPSRDKATLEIAAALENFYRDKLPAGDTSNKEALKAAIAAVQSVYLHNIFPEMKVTWGTYPNNIGHADFPGCFRCHDGNHTSADGRTIPNDCSTCHDMMAVQEQNPKILNELGMNLPATSAGGGTK